MPPKMVKVRKYGDRGLDDVTRLWVTTARNFRTAEEHGEWMDGQIAWLSWVSGFGRMWRYIAMWEARKAR